MKNKISLIIIAGATIGIMGMSIPNATFENNKTIHSILGDLNKEQPNHIVMDPNPNLVSKGKELVTQGFTTSPEGNKSKRISIFFSCTDCHNLVREDPDLTNPNPIDRLAYADKNKLPFLQGTTLYGVTNRTSWYNGDYVKKYGKRAVKSNTDLKEAIQLCAEICSQGRPLEEWEVNSLLHYFSANSITWGDIKNNPAIEQSNYGDELSIAIQNSYSKISSATFPKMPGRLDLGYDFEGNPLNGEKIYKLSCRTCHDKDGPSTVELDYSKSNFRDFNKNYLSKGNSNLYKIVTSGTYPELGHKPYMPLFPEERLNKQQVEDLKAYFIQEANR
ncbi:MAG: mono/diheme cytochrome c family protein [Sphingobacteriales bacterium]|jgi:mono/diheme cytochrome c family protein